MGVGRFRVVVSAKQGLPQVIAAFILNGMTAITLPDDPALENALLERARAEGVTPDELTARLLRASLLKPAPGGVRGAFRGRLSSSDAFARAKAGELELED